MKSVLFSLVLSVGLAAGLMVSAKGHAVAIEMPQTEQETDDKREPLLREPSAAAPAPQTSDHQGGPTLKVVAIRLLGVTDRVGAEVTVAGLSRRLLQLSLVDDAEVPLPHLAVSRHEDALLLGVHESLRDRFTLSMLEFIGDEVTRYYRERGLILAKVYIPKQQVRDGVVALELLVGRLGEVVVRNNKRYKTGALTKAFAGEQGEPVDARAIEEALYLLNDLPGLDAQAWFAAGSEVGSTQLNLNVNDEKRFVGNLRLDNYGSPSTGEYRVYTDGYWYNPSGYGDELHLGVLATFEPSNSTYGAVHYSLPLFRTRARVRLGGSSNAFESTFEGLTLSGQSQAMNASLAYKLKRSRTTNRSWRLQYSHIDTDIEQVLDDSDDETLSGVFDDYDTRVQNLDLVFHFDWLNEPARALHQGSIRVGTAAFEKGQRVGQPSHPLIVQWDHTWMKMTGVPFGEAQSRVVLNLSAQYAGDALPSTSQFALTGPYRMRGLANNSYNADRAFYSGADWLFRGPGFLGPSLASRVQPFLFADLAYGRRHGVGLRIPEEGEPIAYDTAPDNCVSMADLGFGLRYNDSRRVRASLYFAQVVHYRLNQGYRDQDGDTPRLGISSLEDRRQWWFELQYSF